MEARVSRLEAAILRIDESTAAIRLDTAEMKGRLAGMPDAKDFGELKGRVNSLPTTATFATVVTIIGGIIGLVLKWGDIVALFATRPPA